MLLHEREKLEVKYWKGEDKIATFGRIHVTTPENPRE